MPLIGCGALRSSGPTGVLRGRNATGDRSRRVGRGWVERGEVRARVGRRVVETTTLKPVWSPATARDMVFTLGCGRESPMS